MENYYDKAVLDLTQAYVTLVTMALIRWVGYEAAFVFAGLSLASGAYYAIRAKYEVY
jgi:hypothetical protein